MAGIILCFHYLYTLKDRINGSAVRFEVFEFVNSSGLWCRGFRQKVEG